MILGLVIICLSLLLYLLFLYKLESVTKINLFILFVFLYLLFFFLESSYVTKEADDLYRYYALMDTFQYFINMNDINGIILFIFNGKVPVWSFMLLILSFFENNTILVYMTTGLIFFIFYYILSKLQEKNKYPFKTIIYFIVCFFSIITPYHIMFTIRNALAISVFALGLYYLEDSKKNIFVLLSILSFFIHNSVIIIIILVIISLYLEKMKVQNLKKLLKIVLLFVPLIIKIVVILLQNINNSIAVKILNLVPYALKLGPIFDWRVLVGIEAIVFISILIGRKQKIKLYIIYILYFILGSFPFFLIVERYAFFVPYALILSYKPKQLTNNRLYVLISLVSVGLLLLNINLIHNYFDFELFYNL